MEVEGKEGGGESGREREGVSLKSFTIGRDIHWVEL